RGGALCRRSRRRGAFLWRRARPVRDRARRGASRLLPLRRLRAVAVQRSSNGKAAAAGCALAGTAARGARSRASLLSRQRRGDRGLAQPAGGGGHRHRGRFRMALGRALDLFPRSGRKQSRICRGAHLGDRMRRLAGGKLVVATHNPGKLREIAELLEPYGVQVIPISGYGLPEPEETGGSFRDNARIKAEAAARATGLPALADDSGLCVEALDG